MDNELCKCRALPDRGDGDGIEYCPLHAAAPALLEALEGIISVGKRDMTNEKYDGYFESARAAIAQARGDK